MPRAFLRFIFPVFFIAALGMSCGIEDYKYLRPVYSGDIDSRIGERVFIRIPGGSQPAYFNYYIIYYRIYISGTPISGSISADQLDQINPALANDYRVLLPYTNTDNTVVPTTINSTFVRQKYYVLALSDNSRLDAGSSGTTITLDFARTFPSRPALFMGDTRVNPSLAPIDLLRYSEVDMRPYANNRYFVNSSDLNDGELINQITFTNLDVANIANVSGRKETYVSMYILAYGIDAKDYSPIYSTPTFIGIFRLPD
jgi:hypothetical protein